MEYVIPDRHAVAQIKYQLRRFEKQCAGLPTETFLLLQEAMLPLRQVLSAIREDDEPENA